MATPRHTGMVHDLLQGGSNPTLDSLHPEVLAQTRAAYDALYRQRQVVPGPVLHALAAQVCAWQGASELRAWHLEHGGQPALLEGTEPSDPRWSAVRAHVDLLSVSPALSTAGDQQVLTSSGLDPDQVVLVSQLVAFESYLIRVLWVLSVLDGQLPATVEAPDRPLHGRGRRKLDSETTAAGSQRPLRYTQDVLRWEPWVAVQSEAELSADQRESFAAKATLNSVYFRLISRTPALTRARSHLDNAIFRRPEFLPKAERELVAAVASKVNDCIYCASVHARKSTGFSKRGDDVDRLLAVELPRDADWVATDLTPLSRGQDERWSTIIDAAARLSQVRPDFDQADVARLTAVGLGSEEILDLATATAFFAWANRLMLSLGEAAVSAAPPS